MKKQRKHNKKVIPLFQTSVLTANKEQVTNKIPKVTDENVILGKKYVDEHHM